MKYLAPFSTLANFVTVISFGIIFYFIFREPIVLDGKRSIGPLAEIPFFIGTVLFSLESVGVVSKFMVSENYLYPCNNCKFVYYY